MTNLGFLGDTHGNAGVVQWTLDQFKRHDVTEIMQVGDFGFWPGKAGQEFLSQVETHLALNGQTLYVTPGNHEDYTSLKYLHTREDGWQEAREHILVAPRGHRWEWEGISFVSLGGAPSVDRGWRLDFQRRQGYPVWWKEEDITREDMDRAIEGGYADVMIAHDAPFGVPAIERGIAGNPNGFREEDLEYADAGRAKMLEVVSAVKPKLFFHGHYHWKVDDILTLEDSEVSIKGLSADGSPNSWGIMDFNMKFRWGPSLL